MRRALVILVVVVASGGLLACWYLSPSIEVDHRPSFRIDPDKPYRIELGRGSGWHGLNTIAITQDGQVMMSREKRDYGADPNELNWELAEFKLPSKVLAQVLAAVEEHRIMRLHRSYSDCNVNDGTQWVVWIKQGEHEKSVYFDNYFPASIRGFAQRLDQIVAANSRDISWKLAETRIDRELWNNLKRY